MATSRKWWIAALAAYILAVHAILVAAILKTDLLERGSARLGIHYGDEFRPDARSFRAAYFLIARINRTLLKSPVVFLGDSLVEDLPRFPDLPRALNLGIGGSSLPDVGAMMTGYRNLHRAAAIVINAGANDFCVDRSDSREFAGRLEQFAAALPANTPIVWSSILPIDPTVPAAACTVQPDLIKQANTLIADQCTKRRSCIYSDGFAKLADARGYLPRDFHAGDGMHLSLRGYEVWAVQLRADIARLSALRR